MSGLRAALIEGRAIHYRLDGPAAGAAAGPALVFSNSLGTDLRVWDALLPHLPADGPLLRYDTAGHGLSERAPGHTIADHARDLLAVMDAAGIERAAVVGLSVGGMIAQALAALVPARVDRLVLCATAHRIGTPALWDDRIAGVERDGLDAMAEGVLTRWFSPAFRRERPAELALWRAMLTRTPAAGYADLCAAIRDADLEAEARAIAAPTLCVAGEADGATPPETVAATAALIPGARTETLAGAGHLPCVEAPEALGALIRDHLEESPRVR